MKQRKNQMQKIAECINILGDFCAKRDVSQLTCGELEGRYGFSQADVMAFFGGSIMEGSIMPLYVKRKESWLMRKIYGGCGIWSMR